MNFLYMLSVSPMGNQKMVGTVNKIISNLFHLDIHAAWNLKPEGGASKDTYMTSSTEQGWTQWMEKAAAS